MRGCGIAQVFLRYLAPQTILMPTVHLAYFKSVKPLVSFVRKNAGRQPGCAIWSLIVGICAQRRLCTVVRTRQRTGECSDCNVFAECSAASEWCLSLNRNF